MIHSDTLAMPEECYLVETAGWARTGKTGNNAQLMVFKLMFWLSPARWSSRRSWILGRLPWLFALDFSDNRLTK
jgi:hypothetical protein